jgi:hypothetical protein
VGEDAFDRLPSRRFERRGEDRRHVARHEDFAREERDDEGWADERGASERFARRDYPQRRIVDDAAAVRNGSPLGDEAAARRDDNVRDAVAGRDDDAAARRDDNARDAVAGRDYDAAARRDGNARDAAAGREPDAPVAPRRRRQVTADWLEETAFRELPDEPAEDAIPRTDSDGRRTIVIGGALEGEIPPPDEPAQWPSAVGAAGETAPGLPRERRTIVIGGHPDALPAMRQRRPPRTAVERIGTRPDRFVAYAVAMGFLLILIAILTTGH